MKVLVIGRHGQLARALLEAAAAAGADVLAIGRPAIDVVDPASVAAAIAEAAPAVVINTAAYTAVDRAETEPAIAHAINAAGAEAVAQACAANGIPLIQVSTDYVFDGAKDGAYREDDRHAPLNVYGRTKLEGERRVANACVRHLILRTAWLHSPWGSNFVTNMLQAAMAQPALRVVDDQTGSPTYAPHLAVLLLALARRAIADPAGMRWGVYHAAGAGEATRLAWACEIFRHAVEEGLPAVDVIPIDSAAYPAPARRPVNSRLDCERLKLSFGLELPDWRVGVRECVSRLSNCSLGRRP